MTTWIPSPLSTGIDVDVDSVLALAAGLDAAARAAADLHDHPGVVAGRAADCGDDELASAVVALARAWDDGLAVLRGQLTFWAGAAEHAAQTYTQVEGRTLASFALVVP
jgi:hypothetical protein